MENVRSGNMKVSTMKTEIDKDIVLLEALSITKRRDRQIDDGKKFLEMISKAPYMYCRTVSQLKKKISEQRNKIKQDLMNMDRYMPGHQFSFFETAEDISVEDQKKLEKKKEECKQEMHWLHKCLGMCSSRNYFK